ncbi:MAG: hypothetical protein GON13_01520 [Nanoarchaeota archaeon]|nr:hypothetical protein [Nanoarchaeota archaeon]
MKLLKMGIEKSEDFVNKSLVVLEGINRLQVEKNSIIESYYRIKNEYANGSLGFGVFEDSVKQLNNELKIVDNNILEQIRVSTFSVNAIKNYVNLQRPIQINFVAEKL